MLFQSAVMYGFKFRQDVVAVLNETDEFAHVVRIAAVELVNKWEEAAAKKAQG